MISRIFLLLLIAFAVLSCKKKKDQFCTEEFVSYSLKVIGDTLTDFYTVRNRSYKDTIRPKINAENLRNNIYPVLDDNYQPEMENSKVYFLFIGKVDENIVVAEEFLFKADDCHIQKISGKSEVTIP